MGIENPVHIMFLAVVALIVLGPKRLPELARAAGKGMREFRESLSGETITGEAFGSPTVEQPVAQAPLTQQIPPSQQAPLVPQAPLVQWTPPEQPQQAPAAQDGEPAAVGQQPTSAQPQLQPAARDGEPAAVANPAPPNAA
jgi:TatA/E family protein of Tat protein translocase